MIPKLCAELTQALSDFETLSLPADISLKDHLEAKQTIKHQLGEDCYAKLKYDSGWNQWIFRVYQEDQLFYRKAYRQNGNPEVALYYFNDQPHREDGPAFEWFYENGNLRVQEHYLNGQRHRKDGPAVEWFDEDGNSTSSYYYLNGQRLSEEGWSKQVNASSLGSKSV